MLEFLSWVAMGALAGWIATLITGTNERYGALSNILIGIVGAFLGGLVVRLFGGGQPTGFDLGSVLTAILGAVILLSALKAFRRSRV
jgi:uncharacterized membrane protein YeaQ/YmgE (transglycosylase-associated protein family)